MSDPLRGLSTMAEVNAQRRATPKHLVPTKVDQLKARLAADREDARKLADWAKRVKKRDDYIDRFDGGEVLKTAQAHPRRAEAAHIVSRSDHRVRYDVRNGITLSYENHVLLHRGELVVGGDRKFKVDGKQYIDGRYAWVIRRRT